MEKGTFQYGFAGRQKELEELKAYYQEVEEGEGRTVFISGEAGVGKTRLVEELFERSTTEKNAKVIKGKCLSDRLKPLMPIREALRDADLGHLISQDPPPKVKAAYLMNDAGLLAAKAERKDTEMDADIFISMLSAVESFVQDSLSMMDEEERRDLNTIGYGDHDILVQTVGSYSLACVIEGTKSESLIDDMKGPLVKANHTLDDWQGDMEEVEKLVPEVEWFIDSSKYDGKFLVDDPEVKQENLFENILLGLRRLATEKPVIVFIDDLQWADPTTLDLLHYLSRNTGEDSVLILGTYRPEDIVEGLEGKTHQLKTVMQDMGREGLYEKIELERLDESVVSDFIEKMLGEIKLEKENIERFYKESEGNPFFLLEILRMLVDEGYIAEDEDVRRVTKPLDEVNIPSRVYDVVVRRLDRLGEEQRDLLECASVVGEEFESGVLERVSGMDRVKLLKDLNEIEKTHYLIHSFQKKYEFDHSKIREVLYSRLNEELRQEYHRMVAESYEELYEDDIDEVIENIGHHYYKAEDLRGVKYLVDLGDKAKKAYSNEEAEQFYKHALSLIEGDEVEASKRVYVGLGEVYGRLGKYDDALESYQDVLEIVEEDKKRAGLYGEIAGLLDEKGKYEGSLKHVEKGLSLVGKKDVERGKLLNRKGWVFMRMGDYDRALEVFKEERDFAEERGEEKERAQSLHDMGSVYLREGDDEKAEDLLQKAIHVREEIEDTKGLSESLNNLGIIYYNKGDLAKVLEYYERCLEIEEEIGDKHGIALSLVNIGNIYSDKGELDEALDYYEQSLEIEEEIGDKRGIATSLNNIALIYSEKGELDRALEYQKWSLEIEEEIGDKEGIALSLGNIGETHVKKENLEKAEKNAEKAFQIARDIGAKDLEARGRRVLGMVYREKERWDDAREEFERSLEISKDVGKKQDVSWEHYEYGLMWKAKGEEEKAKTHLDKALSMFKEMGMEIGIEKTKEALSSSFG
ncbi:MAG: tetratricopeptide repeat protein [Candidatus Thermoplasmatota archaeon]|nr:tetratricopeptide repeat protein [Candidatus Thermoplasmatota archaeon]